MCLEGPQRLETPYLSLKQYYNAEKVPIPKESIEKKRKGIDVKATHNYSQCPTMEQFT